jgi:ABC-type lipoprotein export system ATPase subunit
MANKYPKGAEWRKWDLHVHTPNSIYQRFGENNDYTWEMYISDLENLPKSFAVLGINDYLFLEGYTRLKNEQNKNNRLQGLKLLPVVEFRIEKFAGIQFGALKRINLHVIFSDELSVEMIKSQFLNTLEQSYTLESGEEWTRSITPESVSELGASIKAGVPEEQLSKYGTDLVEGFNNLNVKEEQIFKSLNKDCFQGKYLIAIGKTEWSELRWTDASIATKKTIINNADIVFTASENIEKFNNSKAQLREQGVNDFLLDCSDAHYLSSSTDKDRIGNCFTWLKADSTFDGLLQVINEPKERVFIGDTPTILKKVENHKTKYIKELKVSHIEGYEGNQGIWFQDITIPFNSELVAIIGNKGSGKSAVADIISLCSNYYSDNDFSFLTSKKFREKSGKIAKNYIAKLTWESGSTEECNLYETPDSTEVLDVKYIPQGQFENLTNEISSAEEFQKEIESVVFSHIPETERLGTVSFDELIEKKSSVVDTELDALFDDIREINKKIIELENKGTDSYRTSIEHKRDKKMEELEALTEPTEVTNPNNDPEKRQQSEAINKRIDKIKEELNHISESISEANNRKSILLENIELLTRVKREVEQKNIEVNRFVKEKSDELSPFEIDITTFISISVDTTELDVIIQNKTSALEIEKKVLGELEPEDGYVDMKQQLLVKTEELKAETDKLNSEQKAYQEYLIAKNNWQNECNRITGTAQTPDSLEFYKEILTYINQHLTVDLESQYDNRRTLVREIFEKRQEVLSIYKDAREQLNRIIDDQADTLKDYTISVEAALVLNNSFEGKFLDSIDKGKSGSFYSKPGGEARIKKLTEAIDFDQVDSVIAFLDSIIEALHHDLRDDSKEKRNIADQVKDIEDLYDYLFTLRFLDRNYQLKQGDKNLEQLSPGERGALLLVFYLLLDKNDIPLIIDQPEDNLDNNSVATVLVPFIREAKKKRQIIMVTHNPNLAVVSDAEQVIYVELDKKDGNKFITASGSIEDRTINEKIVKVLEGAMPAFNTRKRKYYDHK